MLLMHGGILRWSIVLVPHRKQDGKSQDHDRQDSVDQKTGAVLFRCHDSVKRSAKRQDGVSAGACKAGMNMLYGGWRRGSESNRRIKVLQTSPLPLGYRAIKIKLAPPQTTSQGGQPITKKPLSRG